MNPSIKSITYIIYGNSHRNQGGIVYQLTPNIFTKIKNFSKIHEKMDKVNNTQLKSSLNSGLFSVYQNKPPSIIANLRLWVNVTAMNF